MTEIVVRLDTSDTGVSQSAQHVTVRWLARRDTSTLSLDHATPFGPFGPHTAVAEDFLAIAVAAYCADRAIERSRQADGWTRHIAIDVPVRHPDRWDTDGLATTLSFLTGDRWRIALRPGDPHPGLRIKQQVDPIDAAVLFSGGVDSLTGAVDARARGEAIALVSHFGDSPTGSLQHDLATELGLRDRHLSFRLTATARDDHGWPGFVDTTMRSRSILFLALGLLVARTRHADRVTMAENGYIAVNVPLHEGRVGSLSTRTAHPGFLEPLNRQIFLAGLGAQIHNPYLLMTKGDVTEHLIAAAPNLAARTVSCAHPIGRWRGEGFRNCGYCYPCIIRQAGFHHTGADPTTYGTDPFTDLTFYETQPDAASDMRSVARFLLEPVRLGDLLATGRLPDYPTALTLHDMRVRGVREIANLFGERLSTSVSAVVGP